MKTNWNRKAKKYAMLANANYDVRSSVEVSEEPVEHVVFFNNLNAEKLPKMRPRQLDEMARRLREVGVDELARATAPDSGPNEGISAAVIYKATAAQRDTIEATFDDVYARFEHAWSEE